MHQVLYSTSHGIPDHVLRSMFEARKRVFVDLLKWNVPILEGRFEIDQFDDTHASYLILADQDGVHLGSARLLQTMRPHILGNLFAELCESSPPRGEHVFEITRFCLDRSLNARDRRSVRDTLVTAIVVHALDRGIRTYTAIAEMGWFQQILAFGWTCAPLGMPRRHEGTLIAALAIEIDIGTLSLLAKAGIRPQPIILASDMRIAA
jgi:N-acyl-L-homoserine lactone synthetase